MTVGLWPTVDISRWLKWAPDGQRTDAEDVGDFCWRRITLLLLLLLLLRLLVMRWSGVWLRLRWNHTSISRSTTPDRSGRIVGS